MMMMMIKERRDIRPLLVKFGVAFALSFAGFLYARMKNKRIKASDSPRSPPPSNSDSDKRVDYGDRPRIKQDPQPDIGSGSMNTYDKPCIRVRVDTSSRNASPGVNRYSGDRDGLLLPEFDQLVREYDMTAASRAVTSPKADMETYNINRDLPKAIRSIEMDDYKREIETLKKKIRFLRDRERTLEAQLLEYYGLKEQESALFELQNRLKINNIETKLFNMKIETLQADNRRLEAQVTDYSKVVCELEAAKVKIKQLKRKIRYEAEHSKEQIFELTQRVTKMLDQENEASTSNSNIHTEHQRLQELEHEAEELRKSNEKLQHENADLAHRLDSTQILANSILEDHEKEELHKEMLRLREENEKLSKEVERFQADRCADAEELVYLRWINACLRYELRNFQPPPGKTVARDLSKSLSPMSEKKAKELILEYANGEDGEKEPGLVDFDFDQWPSSQPSYITDGDHGDSPGSTSGKKPNSKKMKFFAKLRRLIRGKYGRQSTQTSPIIRSLSVDDLRKRYSSFESPQHMSSGETGAYDRSGSRSPMLASSSQNSNNSSLEHQQLTSLAEEEGKYIESGNRMSDSGSSRGNVRFVLGKGSSSSSPLDYRTEQEAEDGQKSDLARYAEVIRDSRSLPRMHQKSASFTVG